VGAEDEEELIKPKAYVVLKDGSSGSDEITRSIKEFVKERIAPYKCPRWIEFVDELPKTATGKIQRFKLRLVGNNGGGEPNQKPMTQDDMLSPDL
jgi:benzoate-CoA ligase